MSRTRTNIEIDDELVARVMERYQISTKTEAVNFALRYLGGLWMSREQMLAMRGANAIGEVPADVGPRGLE